MSPYDTDFTELSIWELFRFEVEDKSAVLTQGVLALERGERGAEGLEELMRAAHSLKGAAAMVEARSAVEVAHAMEDWFVGAQQGKHVATPVRMDLLLEGVDLLRRIAASPDAESGAERAQEVRDFLTRLAAPDSAPAPAAAPVRHEVRKPNGKPGNGAAPASAASTTAATSPDEQAVRVTAERLNRLLALAGESLVTTRWLDEFLRSAARGRQIQRDIADGLERFRDSLMAESAGASTLARAAEIQRRFSDLRQAGTIAGAELEEIQRRAAGVAVKLYREVVDLRMRPFSEGVGHLGRLVRGLARQLDKEVTLEIRGESTPVDRDIMERLDAPIVNLIRNALDHGIEPPAERLRLGKPATGTVRLEASHRAGMLFIVVEDDGRGVDLDGLRHEVALRKHTTPELAARMSDAEVLDFLFLPGFSLKDTVTEISGRGVGLDIVQTAARAAGGKLSVNTRPGAGLQFIFQLPLTLSVLRALLFEVGGEPYAVPIARVDRVLKVRKDEIESVQGRQHIAIEGERIGLVAAHQVLGIAVDDNIMDEVPVLMLGQGTGRYGLTVERLLGERELVVRPLDPLLGKLKDISSAALLPDRTPVLILDVEDVLHSIEHLISGGRLEQATATRGRKSVRKSKRILVVEDSFTVRELERKVLSGKGYEVDVAVDGVDGWNAVRAGQYDLVVTDIDMPRMDGIELVNRIRQDARLHLLPIIIVSYKEREEDRLRGMEAGADRYLTKGSYHDESLIHAIVELIGASGDA